MDSIKRNHYEFVLADLEAQRRELDNFIAYVRRMLGQEIAQLNMPLATVAEAERDEVRSDTFFGMSIGEAAKKFLRLRKKKQTTSQIVEALEKGGMTHASDNFAATVSSVLSREAKRGGDLVRVARGEWGLVEWYPGIRQKRPSAPREASDDMLGLGGIHESPQQ